MGYIYKITNKVDGKLLVDLFGRKNKKYLNLRNLGLEPRVSDL